ncbi:MAG: hypothetical protein K1X38_08910 [Microthrixaceae bacterium]|nr:hypothetical protein [Microthrixaceae bacterium]
MTHTTFTGRASGIERIALDAAERGLGRIEKIVSSAQTRVRAHRMRHEPFAWDPAERLSELRMSSRIVTDDEVRAIKRPNRSS